MSENKPTKAQIEGMNFDQLKDLLVTVLAEARKPVVTEADVRAAEQAHKDRLEMAQLIINKMKADEAFKKVCPHLRRDGSTRCVLIHLNGGQYLLCQRCQDKIFYHDRPEMFSHHLSLTNADNGMFA